jgi:hypothetical protein
MIPCKKCKRKMFVDRVYNSISHIETYCLHCGTRVFYHPPENSVEGKWLLAVEKIRAKNTISLL